VAEERRMKRNKRGKMERDKEGRNKNGEGKRKLNIRRSCR
jgi:hypothetical protein